MIVLPGRLHWRSLCKDREDSWFQDFKVAARITYTKPLIILRLERNNGIRYS